MKSWSKFEKIWLGVFLVAILAVTAIFSSTGTNYDSMSSILLNWFISPFSAITGIVCVVLVARGSKWNYLWGFFNAVSYGYLAYVCGYYGDAILNIFFFLPFQFIGYFWWNNHLRNKSKNLVRIKKLSFKAIIAITLGSIVSTILIGLALFKIDSWFTTAMKRNVSIYQYLDSIFHIKFLGAIFDSSTEVLQIVGQLLMTFAYAQQWIFWILTNIITIIMWLSVIIANPSSIPWALPTLVMWVAYLVNSVYGYVNWLRDTGK